MNAPASRRIIHIDEIPDLLPDKALTVMNDYRWSGAEVSSELQTDGKVKVTAKFLENAVYPASGAAVIRK